MAICIEPMFNLGTSESTVDDDGWTVRTLDGKKVCTLRAYHSFNRGGYTCFHPKLILNLCW